jgi:hypothetical protein
MSMEFLSLMWNSSGVNAGEELQRYLGTEVYLRPKAGTRPGLCAAELVCSIMRIRRSVPEPFC